MALAAVNVQVRKLAPGAVLPAGLREPFAAAAALTGIAMMLEIKGLMLPDRDWRVPGYVGC